MWGNAFSTTGVPLGRVTFNATGALILAQGNTVDRGSSGLITEDRARGPPVASTTTAEQAARSRRSRRHDRSAVHRFLDIEAEVDDGEEEEEEEDDDEEAGTCTCRLPEVLLM